MVDFEKELTVDESGSIEIEVVTEGSLTSRQSQSVSASEGDTVRIHVKTS